MLGQVGKSSCHSEKLNLHIPLLLSPSKGCCSISCFTPVRAALEVRQTILWPLLHLPCHVLGSSILLGFSHKEFSHLSHVIPLQVFNFAHCTDTT